LQILPTLAPIYYAPVVNYQFKKTPILKKKFFEKTVFFFYSKNFNQKCCFSLHSLKLSKKSELHEKNTVFALITYPLV
jgi:hypothetical protein